MGLDVRTMIFMMVALSLSLSGLLALASFHSGNIRGIRQWAIANLAISIGLGLAFTSVAQNHWVFVVSAPLIALGAGLQITGIQAFEQRRPDWRIPLGLVSLAIIANLFFSVLTFNITLRVISNSLIYGVTCAFCARALLIRIAPPLRTAYWLTGSAFAILTLFMLARIGFVLAANPQHNYILSPEPINQFVFFLISIMLLFISFGFVLMLNYRLASDLTRLAARDSLTHALNRRSLEEVASQLQAHFSRSGGNLALLMLDVDHFKTVNDRYGHLVGDAVLVTLAGIAHQTVRTEDYFARYGGEEFCVLLPGTTESDACILADRLRQVFADTPMDCGRGEVLRCTVSIGVADSLNNGLSFKGLVAAADTALYHAKQAGRNRVVTASSLSSDKRSEAKLAAV